MYFLISCKARKEAIAKEHEARRQEVAELGGAVGLDVAKLHDSMAQQMEAERRARDSLARKVWPVTKPSLVFFPSAVSVTDKQSPSHYCLGLLSIRIPAGSHQLAPAEKKLFASDPADAIRAICWGDRSVLGARKTV